jgi:HlyD family secretion protein
MKKMLTLLVPVLLILLSACGAGEGGAATATPVVPLNLIVAEGHAVPAQSIYLIFPVRGRVEQVLVERGDTVSQGQVLARLGDRQGAEAALAAAQLELTAAQQTYDSLVRTADLGHAQAWQAYLDARQKRAAAQLAWDRLDLNALQVEIDNAQADVTSRQADLESAQTDFDKYIDLPAENATRKTYENALRTAQTELDLAVQELETLSARRDSLRATLDASLALEDETRRTYENTAEGADVDKLALAQARLTSAQAQAEAAASALENYDLKAPFSGVVADVNISAYEFAGPETWAVALVDTSDWYVDTSDLSELDVVEVAIGEQVEVTADSLPGVLMHGEVEQISNAPHVLNGDILYTVRIRLSDPDPRLLWGMTMEVTFPAK